MERKWTTAQQHCIDARGGTVLVSAAAGSGKTAVLIERIVGLLTDPAHPVSIDRLLVVTFTKAAAAEMRARLNAALSARTAEDPHNRHLLRQQLLLPQANICTIHSFCSQILREYARQADVSPRFQVAEQTALNLLSREIASQLIEDRYKAGDAAFLQLCDLLSGDRDDKHLIDEMLRLYDFIQAHPFPMEWLEKQERCFRETASVRHTVWAELLIGYAREQLESAVQLLEQAASLARTNSEMTKAYLPPIEGAIHAIENAVSALDGEWDDAVQSLCTLAFPNLKPLKKGFEDTALKERVQALRKAASKAVEDAQKALFCTQDAARSDIAAAAPCVHALFSLVRDYDARFSAAKAEQNLLDFNDLEHRVLSLLATPDDQGGFCRTDIAKEIGARFAHILVDEYQDTNQTQDTLFSALSDHEQNLFFVGDIKQSIYGFRQAMPAIFRHRRESSHPYDAVHFPACITLGDNFRSRKQVTESVNFFFRRLMTKKLGGICYDKTEELVSSNPTFLSPNDPVFDTELLIVDGCKGDDAKKAEANRIGRRILELIADGFPVSDGNTQRRASYGDFCILLRSTSNRASVFIKELQRMGIPVNAGGGENFFDFAEVRLAVSYLRLIDNPLMDIPLIAVLLSPIGGFTPDELAALRTASKKTALYTAMRRIARRDDALAQKCRDFLHTLDTYRLLSASLPVDKLLRRLYEDTAMLPIMGARNGGSRRIANLRSLYDYARRFEQDDFRGLSAFVRYLDKLEKQKIRLESAGGNVPDAVQLMTIHHSKGLEFPVVFVAGLGGNFNNKSTVPDLLLHPEVGVGLKNRDRNKMVQNNTIHRKAVTVAIKNSERAEELRVLYVAMTRAKDKLILTASTDNLTSDLSRVSMFSFENGALSSVSLQKASSMLDWILAVALSHPHATALRDLLPAYAAHETFADFCALHTGVFSAEASDELPPLPLAAREAVRLDGMEERLAYFYPYHALGHIPAKITASAAAHPTAFIGTGFSPLPRPAFLSKDGLTPAQRGTAVHAFLQYVDLSSDVCAKQQACALVERCLLSEEQCNALPLQKLQHFLESPLAKRMGKATLLLREFPFAVNRPVTAFSYDLSDLPEDARAETIVVQGIADALFEENGEIVIVDYKTDRVEQACELVTRYRPQLAIYADALSGILQRKVKACVIYSFSLEKEIPVLF